MNVHILCFAPKEKYSVVLRLAGIDIIFSNSDLPRAYLVLAESGVPLNPLYTGNP